MSGYIADTTCDVPQGTAAATAVPCAVKAVSMTGTATGQLQSITCQAAAAVTGVTATVNLAATDAHTLLLSLGPAGIKTLQVLAHAAALQGDAATPLMAGTVLGQASATTLGLYMRNGDGSASAVYLDAKAASGTATTSKVSCKSTAPSVVPDVAETGPMQGSQALSLPAFEVGSASATTTVTLTCAATTADGTELTLGQTASVHVLALLQPFQVVAGPSVANQAGNPLAVNTVLTTAAANTLQVVAGSEYYGGLAVRVRNTGATAATGYTVTCASSPSNAVVTDFTCVVPGGTAQGGYVPCRVLPGTGQSQTTAHTVTCTSSAVAAALYSQPISVAPTAATGTALVLQAAATGVSASGASLVAGAALSQTLPASIPAVLEGTGATAAVVAVVSAAAATVHCGASDPVALPLDVTANVSATTSAAGVSLGPVPATSTDQTVIVSCAPSTAAAGVQVGQSTTASVRVVAAATFTLYADAAGTQALPTTAAQALVLSEGATLQVFAKVSGDVYNAAYTITCVPTSPLASAATPDNTISGTSSGVEMPGDVLPDSANFVMGQLSADTGPLALTCSAGASPSPLKGSATVYVQGKNTAVAYSLVSGTGRALSTSSSSPTGMDQGELVLRASVAGDVADGAGTITCAEVGTSVLSVAQATISYSSKGAVEAAGSVLPPWASFKAIVAADQTTVHVQCVGDGMVFDKAAVNAYVVIMTGSATSTLQCGVQSGTGANSGLEPAQTAATDVATVTALVADLRVVITAGTANRDASSALRTSGTRMYPTDKTEAVEGTLYGAGGLFQVALSGNPPEAVTVTCTLDSAQTAVLTQSSSASDYTLSFSTANGATPQNLTFPAVGSISAPADVTLTCIGRGLSGLLPATATTVVHAVPIAIVIEAGSSAVSDAGAALAKGTAITGGGAGREVRRVEGVPDSLGASAQVRLNGNPTGSVSVTCTSQAPTTLPDSANATDYVLTFTGTNGRTPQPIRLGTVADISADTVVEVRCAPLAAGGFAATETQSFYVQAVKLSILITAGTSAVDAGGTAYAVGAAITNKASQQGLLFVDCAAVSLFSVLLRSVHRG